MENTILEILSSIQRELKAPKNQLNSFGNYNYRSCEDILEGLKPLLAKTKSVILISDEVVLIGSRFYVKATATLKSAVGECIGEISVSAYAREPEEKKGMDLAQLTGATSSYARKYALNGLFAIDDTKDADSQNNAREEVKKPIKEPVKETPKVALTVAQSLLKKTGDVFNLIAVVHDTTEREGKNKTPITDYKVSDNNSETRSIISKYGKTLEGLNDGDCILFKDVKVYTYQGNLTYLAKEAEKIGK